MRRERALKVALIVVGLLFAATAYPLILFVRKEPALAMMLGLYVTLGIFLLLAVREPSAHRSLIAFTAWSSFAHAAVMTVQSVRDVGERLHLLAGSAMFVLIGLAFIALAAGKQAAERASAVGA